MTLTEKQAWLSLVAILLVGAYCVANFTDGWAIPDHSSAAMWRTWIAMLVAGTVAEIVIGMWVADERSKGALSDERDRAMVARADQIAMGIAFTGVNVLVWQALWQGSRESLGLIPSVAMPDLTHLPTLIFGLLMILVITHAVKQGAIIVLGRL
jgi:hypothetical protein